MGNDYFMWWNPLVVPHPNYDKNNSSGYTYSEKVVV
jgi:hypothetical protein